jgi:hypothetical protein
MNILEEYTAYIFGAGNRFHQSCQINVRIIPKTIPLISPSYPFD